MEGTKPQLGLWPSRIWWGLIETLHVCTSARFPTGFYHHGLRYVRGGLVIKRRKMSAFLTLHFPKASVGARSASWRRFVMIRSSFSPNKLNELAKLCNTLTNLIRFSEMLTKTVDHNTEPWRLTYQSSVFLSYMFQKTELLERAPCKLFTFVWKLQTRCLLIDGNTYNAGSSVSTRHSIRQSIYFIIRLQVERDAFSSKISSLMIKYKGEFLVTQAW